MPVRSCYRQQMVSRELNLLCSTMFTLLQISTWAIAFVLPISFGWDLGYGQDYLVNGINANYADGLFSPVESLSTLSATEFTTMGHPFFPRYSVRVKKSQFCDETVK